MVAGRLRTFRRARYCSSAWFFLRMAKRWQLSIGFGQRQHCRVARSDGFDLGVGELLAADILSAADCRFAGYDLGVMWSTTLFPLCCVAGYGAFDHRITHPKRCILSISNGNGFVPTRCSTSLSTT